MHLYDIQDAGYVMTNLREPYPLTSNKVMGNRVRLPYQPNVTGKPMFSFDASARSKFHGTFRFHSGGRILQPSYILPTFTFLSLPCSFSLYTVSLSRASFSF